MCGDTIPCSFCDGPTGPWDNDSMIDSAGVYCGHCTRAMGLDGEIILPCGLCRFPILGESRMVDGHDYEYCEHCANLLGKAGFVVVGEIGRQKQCDANNCTCDVCLNCKNCQWNDDNDALD